MEEGRVLSYVRGLERKLRDGHQYLKETVEELREMCRVISPEKNVPQGIIVDIRELHKEIQNRFKEVRGIDQLLRGKYRQFYHRDALRDKDLLELGFVVKTTFSRFEENLKVYVEKEKIKEREKALRISQRGKILEWFNSREKQIQFLRKMRTLRELDYAPLPGRGVDERRGLGGIRSLTLFLLCGESQALDAFQSRMHFREHDLVERYHEREFRGVLTHLKEVDPGVIEKLFQRFFEEKGALNLKCVLLPVYPQKEIDPERMESVAGTLKEMREGEIRTLST